MSNFVANSLSEDGSKLVGVDASGKIHAWSIAKTVPQSYRSACVSLVNPSITLKGAKIMVEFVDRRHFIVIAGSLGLVIDSDHLFLHDSALDSADRDPPYLLYRVGLPCVATCISSGDGSVLIGGDHGLVYVLGSNGHIIDTFRVDISESISAVRLVGSHSLILGTDRGQISIYDIMKRKITSSWRSAAPSPSVSWIAVDPKANWFCATVNSNQGQKSWLVTGSTRTLVQVFESSASEGELRRCEFAQLSSKGLCVISSSATKSGISVRSLDLSSEPRSMHDGEGGIADIARTARGDILAICGTNRPIQILSSSALGIIRQLVVE